MSGSERSLSTGREAAPVRLTIEQVFAIVEE